MVRTEGGWPGSDPSGGVSPPVTLPTAPASLGEQYTSYSLSDGSYNVSAASIHTANAYNEDCRISLVYVDGAGGETEIVLQGGQVSLHSPFSLLGERRIVGPGELRGYVQNLAATGFTFVVSLQRVRRNTR